MNYSFNEDDSTYVPFSNSKNYVASTPIGTMNAFKKFPTVTKPNSIVNIVYKSSSQTKTATIDERETYDNVPLEIASVEASTPNRCSFPSSCEAVFQPKSFVNRDVYLSKMDLRKQVSDSIKGLREATCVKSDFVTTSGPSISNRGQLKRLASAFRTPAYEDILCDKEVESYFDNPVYFNVPKSCVNNLINANQQVALNPHWRPLLINNNNNNSSHNRMCNKLTYNVANNKAFSSNNIGLCASRFVAKNARNCTGNLIGAGLVRQSHGESYC